MGKIKNLIVCDSLEELSIAAADIFSRLSRDSVVDKGSFSVALSGGHTPGMLYELLASDDVKINIPWQDVHLFWCDERCVPPSDIRSNFRLANHEMISKIPIPSQNVHRIKGESDPKESALEYEKELKEFFNAQVPAFDLMLLGLGEDGHTLSLFPSKETLKEEKRLVVETHIEPFEFDRITMTLPVVNNASKVIFLVSGKNKAGILKEVLTNKDKTPPYPAQLVRPRGELIWLADKEAAGLL